MTDRIAEIRARSEADGYGYAPEPAAAVRSALTALDAATARVRELEAERDDLRKLVGMLNDVSRIKDHLLNSQLVENECYRQGYCAGAEAMRESVVEVLVEDECDELIRSVRTLPPPEPESEVG